MRSGTGDPGPLVAIGGAENRASRRGVLSRFAALAGGRGSAVAVIATASSFGPAVAEAYGTAFAALGVEAHPLNPQTRAAADDAAAAGVVDRCDAVFMSGGNQLKLASVVVGTRLGDAVVEAHRRGAVVGGTSAGASALSRHMVAFGGEGTSPKQRMSQLFTGLGLVDGVIIDQHFTERNRIGRLLYLVAGSPSQLGVGIDEDTAAVVTPDGVLEVVGRGAVTVLDGLHAESTVWATRQHRPLMVSGAVLHSLPAGCRFSLTERRLLEPVDVRRSTTGLAGVAGLAGT